MAKALQRRRGTTAEHANFTGLEGEFTYDTTEKRVVAHDGKTKGGVPMAKVSELESAKTELQGKIDQVSSSLDPRILDAASQADILEAVGQVTGGSSVSQPTLEGLQSQISANASNIASKPTPVRYVTEKWSSGANWYVKYNDGWIEQGGTYSNATDGEATISLITSMSTTNYFVTKTVGFDAWFSNASSLYVQVKDRTTNSFKVYMHPSNGLNKCVWYACGY